MGAILLYTFHRCHRVKAVPLLFASISSFSFNVLIQNSGETSLPCSPCGQPLFLNYRPVQIVLILKHHGYGVKECCNAYTLLAFVERGKRGLGFAAPRTWPKAANHKQSGAKLFGTSPQGCADWTISRELRRVI